MHVAHLERTGHYLTIKDNQIVQVTKILINFVIGITLCHAQNIRYIRKIYNIV